MKGIPRIGVVLMVGLLLFTAVEAVQVCHDYTYWRVTCEDPRPPGSNFPQGIGTKTLEDKLLTLGYKDHDISQNANERPESIQSHLKPGDVIIVGTDHSGIVNKDGLIDHWIQDPNAVGQKYNPGQLPKGPIWSKKGACAGGLFQGETFAQFWEHRCPKKPKRVVIWRNPGRPPKC